jgi:hypothetical protein
MRIRQSTLKTWMECPLQAKFKMFERLPSRQNAKASFGTIIHHCIERYNQGAPIEEVIKEFRYRWTNPETMDVAPDYWPKYTTFGSLMEKGVEILSLYHEKVQWEHRTVLASEHRFLVPFGVHELEGTVDHIELKKAGNGRKTLRIVDFKTNSKQPTLPALRFNIQFTTYIYASLQPEFWMGNGPDFPAMLDGEKWYERLQKTARQGVWYHLMTNKEINAGDRDDGDFMRLYRLCHEIEKAVEADVYVPNISGDSCVYCDYTANCNITIPNQQELLDAAL